MKGLGYVSSSKHLHEVSFIRMKEKAVEKRNAVGTNRNADTSSNNMLSINKHFDDVSFRALLDRIRGRGGTTS